MSAVPKISVVVPSYNQVDFIEETLQSLFSQNDPNLQILVVDGCSNDGAADVIRKHAAKFDWWVSEKDRGQSDALNKGFAKADGEWLCWLNSDDLLLPGALAALRAHIAEEPARDWWIGGGYFIDGQRKRIRDYVPPVGLQSPAQLSDWQQFWFAQPSTFFKRSLYDKAGSNVREDLHYAMDLDLWLRLLAHAAPGFIDRELSVYRLHESGKTQAMSVPGEGEIVQVLAAHLGLPVALDRVKRLAQERDGLLAAMRSIERKLFPIFALNRGMHRASKALRQIRSK